LISNKIYLKSHYCATNDPKGIGTKTHCCPAGQYWNLFRGSCQQPNDCYSSNTNLVDVCHTEPNNPFNLLISSHYWDDENCVPNSNGQGTACCAYDLGGKIRYSDTDIIFY
jgi:hypothetical protein